MEKMSRADRAKQFLPFDSLRGYYDLVRKVEKVITPRKFLSQEELDKLSSIISKVKKGMIIKVTYYQTDGYVTLEGMISNIDIVYKKITIVETQINFKDIFKIESNEDD